MPRPPGLGGHHSLVTLRLACVLEHPTQYDPPLWACLARRRRLVPVVYYARRAPPGDREMGRPVSWSWPEALGFEARSLDAASLRASLRAVRPDAVLTAGWTRALTWRALVAARSLRIAVILPSDSTGEEPRRGVRSVLGSIARRASLGCVDGFFTTGRLGAEALSRAGVRSDRTATGLYPVEVECWRSRLTALAAESGRLREAFPPGAFLVLAVTKLAPREDPLLLLEAFARLRRAVPEATLRVVGDGPLRAEMEARVDRLALRECVRLEGYVAYDGLAAHYGAADVFLHAPRREPWGLSVLEALACGVPVVASANVGAAAELVEPGTNGDLARHREPQALADGLARVAAARPRLSALRAAAVDRARSVDVEQAAASLEALVERLREARRG